MHACAAIHEAMTSLTGKHHSTSDQHVEFGTARREHDMRDMNKILDWLHTHDPFDRTQPQLRSLASGLAASDSINCDETEIVGYEIQKDLDNHSFGAAKTKRKQMIHTLDDVKPGVKVDNQSVQIDPSVLFLRCTALAQ